MGQKEDYIARWNNPITGTSARKRRVLRLLSQHEALLFKHFHRLHQVQYTIACLGHALLYSYVNNVVL